MKVDLELYNDWINIKYRFDNFPFLLYDTAYLREEKVDGIKQVYCNNAYMTNIL